MGKAFVLLIIGLGITVGIAGLTLSSRTSDAWKSSIAAYRKATARNIAESGADIYINLLRATPTMRGTYGFALLGGVDTVTISQPNAAIDSVLITSRALYESVRETCTSCVSRSASLTINAPMILSKGATGGNWMLNTCAIDGRNYNYATGVLDGSAPSVRGFTRVDASIPLTLNGGCTIIGSAGGPSPPDTVSLGNAQLDFSTFANSIYAKANTIVSTATNFASVTWGTHAAPKITFVTNTVNINGASSGEGILVVSGETHFNSTFTFNGLIILCTKDPSWAGATAASFSLITCGLTLYGSLIDVGDNCSYTANSPASTYRYSKTVIDYDCSALGVAGSGGKYAVAYWKE